MGRSCGICSSLSKEEFFFGGVCLVSGKEVLCFLNLTVCMCL